MLRAVLLAAMGSCTCEYLARLWQGTLEEAVEADLILHVIDAASPDVLAQQATVYRVLQELGVTDDQLRSRLVEV